MTTINNQYQLYINSVIDLANTLIIKSTDSVDGLNSYITDYYGSSAVNTLLPKTWKYYLNISGEYHATDTVMTVVSIDTLENINFTKENLVTHAATAESYAYGTRLYRELVTKYPTQEMLIKGILYPVDIDTAIAADDGAILGYPSSLVESNEYSLITKLQAWIDGYKIRWTNSQFAISDKLYPATSLGIMYLNLVPVILNIRLEACKTNEAHSFHLNQYLASHGFLNYYIDNLTIKQKLFFYRNIAHIERNAGKRETFDWLVEHIMTERSLPIAEYTMRHNVSNQPTDLYPTLAFHKSPLNGLLSSNPKTVYTLEEVLIKEDDQARDNLEYRDDVMSGIQEDMENSLSNVEATKFLESSVIDYSNSTPYTMEDILLNHWLSLSCSGIYKTYISVNNPKTDEKITLLVKDAFVLYWYAYCKSINIELTDIPTLYAKRVQRIVTNSGSTSNVVTADEILSVVDTTLVSKKIATTALSMQPSIGTIISTTAFNSLCEEIYNAAQMQRNLVGSQEHTVGRGMVANMVERIYSDNFCLLADEGTTYAQWFAARTIDISDLTPDELNTLYLDIVKEATDVSISASSSLKSLQKAMVNLLSQLSSYSIQIAAEINDTSIKKTDTPAVRIGNRNSKSNQSVLLPDNYVDVIDVRSIQKEERTFSLDKNNIFATMEEKVFTSHDIELGADIKFTANGTIIFGIVNLMGARISPHIPLVKNNKDIIPVIGIDTYLALTETQQQNIKDIYTVLQVQPADTSTEQAEADNSVAYQEPRYTTPRYDDEV